MAPDKLTPTDSRVEHHTATINGRTYHYLLGNPSTTPVATILLVHGFPDLSLGWRYQVPLLLSLNLRVIVPDMLGYARTDAPQSLEEYSIKSMSADLAALAEKVTGPGEQIILGGHDWGGQVVWRMTLWHPKLIRAVFSVCTPYIPPNATWIPYETFVKILPNFRYQVQLAGPDVEANVVGRDKIHKFLRGMYGARGPAGEAPFTTETGVLFENLDKMGKSPLLSDEEIDFYADEYSRNGMRGPLNWYRTRELNYRDERQLLDEGRTHISAPAMIVTASRDAALPVKMTEGMEKNFDSLIKRQVNASHWALWEAAEDTNNHIAEFLKGVLSEPAFKASI